MKFPMTFIANTKASDGTQNTWQTTSGEHSSSISIPPEFSGPGTALSPEDLYNHALSNCFVATFKVYAANSKLTFESIEANGVLTVDLDENKKPVMKQWKLNVKIKNPSDTEKANRLATMASKQGFILNSVKTEKEIEIQILK